jgi:hypothetical protein
MSKEEIILGQKVLDKIREVLKRYEDYGKYLRFPYEWGERAFRGWLVYEVFHEVLEWPIKYIVFGELFDVLFVDEYKRPKIYLETKRPDRGLAELDEFKDRVRFYGTLRYAVITDGFTWSRFEVLREKLSVQETVSIDKADPTLVGRFFMPLHAKKFLYEVL